MNRIVVFGNSGAGKSTYARAQCAALECPHMDLDTVAWDVHAPTPTRRPIADSRAEILRFTGASDSWVVEGCYSDLLAIAVPDATEIVFLNPGIETCVANAKRRPWEPHKYATREAQDANLEMLIGWIRGYATRRDEFSYSSHRQLFDGFAGSKTEYLSNEWA